MARINIEDRIWGDFRFQDLLIKVGSRHAAKGMILELWMLAQEYWFPEKQFIPPEKIKEFGLQLVVEAGLAELRNDGYFAIGSEKAFDWLFQKQEAGRRGGEVAAANRALASDKRAKAHVKRKVPSLLSSLSPSSLLSSLSSDSSSSSNSDSISKDLNLPTTPPGKSVPTWEAYRDSYQKRYGTPPVRNAAINSQLSGLVKRLGEEEAPYVAEFFLTHNDAFYVKSMHPVGLMLRDAEKLRTEWATGSRMTGAVAREVERKQHNADNWDEAAKILNERRKINEAV